MTEATVDENLTQSLQQAVADVFSVEAIMVDPGRAGVVNLYGQLLVDSTEAFPVVQRRFQQLGCTPLFHEEQGRQVIRAIPGQLPTTTPNVRLATIFLGLTVISTIFAGTFFGWDTQRSIWENLLSGAYFALPMLAILVAHESGHYVVARRLGVPVTLPFFIPMPLSFLGTMGALIQMKAPPQNRRHLLAVGIAGPLAGLLVALPVLLLGLHLSEVGTSAQACRERQEQLAPDQEAASFLEGNSILYGAAKTAIFGRFLPDCSPGESRTFLDIVGTALFGCPPCEGDDVFLHPVAFAGWAGLLVTGLNLIPAGTLDGGHVAAALLGKKARYLTYAMIVFMVLLGIGLWMGWYLWAGLIFLLGRRSAVPLDEIAQLKGWQMLVAGLMLLLFVLTLMPNPMVFIPIPPAGP